jgi:hypothetical protein
MVTAKKIVCLNQGWIGGKKVVNKFSGIFDRCWAIYTFRLIWITPRTCVRFSLGFPPGAGFPREQSHEELTTWVKTTFSRLQLKWPSIL